LLSECTSCAYLPPDRYVEGDVQFIVLAIVPSGRMQGLDAWVLRRYHAFGTGRSEHVAPAHAPIQRSDRISSLRQGA
jgi:hypothetical protein